MDAGLIRSWLQLPAGDWPPDHYTLLGLEAGESDVARIEQQVYERMEHVRRYQLTHPEPATEAMNRLAQALVCLTDPAAKRAYDAALLPESARSSAPPVEAAARKPVDPLADILGIRDIRDLNHAVATTAAGRRVDGAVRQAAEPVPVVSLSVSKRPRGRREVYAHARRIRQLRDAWR